MHSFNPYERRNDRQQQDAPSQGSRNWSARPADNGWGGRGRGRGRGGGGGQGQGGRERDGGGGYRGHGRGGYATGRYDSRYDQPAPTFSSTGEYVAPERRQKKDRKTMPAVPPTQAYLDATLEPSANLQSNEVDSSTTFPPPLLVLDLNNTLLCRSKRGWEASKQPLARPYLSTFLSYICSSSPPSPAPSASSSRASVHPPFAPRTPLFRPVVHSSSRANNVLSMLGALSLIPPERLPSGPPLPYVPSAPAPYSPDRTEGDVLSLVFTREMMGLNEKDYYGDVETVKDLGRVWEELGLGGATPSRAISDGELDSHSIGARAAAEARDAVGATTTILLDDEAGKAAQQPYNHLPIAPFIVHPQDFPPSIPAPPLPASRDTNVRLEPPLAVLELDPSHPAAADSHLLGTIYLLEQLRRERNIGAAIRAGVLKRIEDGVVRKVKLELECGEEGREVNSEDVQDELARRGTEVCECMGIEVSRVWDGEWREKLLTRQGRVGGPLYELRRS
ncbi:hypothetical protein JCM10207_008879 [Rhodosporidiobolus poonsookiae]